MPGASPSTAPAQAEEPPTFRDVYVSAFTDGFAADLEALRKACALALRQSVLRVFCCMQVWDLLPPLHALLPLQLCRATMCMPLTILSAPNCFLPAVCYCALLCMASPRHSEPKTYRHCALYVLLRLAKPVPQAEGAALRLDLLQRCIEVGMDVFTDVERRLCTRDAVRRTQPHEAAPRPSGSVVHAWL